MPVMIVVPPGSFTMGSSPGETAREHVAPRNAGWERPQHKIAIARAFALAKDLVTTGQWRACVEAGACRAAWPPAYPPKDNEAVRDVSWQDAQAYIAWLNGQAGSSVYALPSEAQWEYAARAGTRTARWWGDDITVDFRHPPASIWGADPVGAYPPNPFGLDDMLGEVWQWTADCWAESYAGAPHDGNARTDGECSRRVIRGGPITRFSGTAPPWRAAARSWRLATLPTDAVGFRVARHLP